MRFLGRVYSGKNMMEMRLKGENEISTLKVLLEPLDTPYLPSFSISFSF